MNMYFRAFFLSTFVFLFAPGAYGQESRLLSYAVMNQPVNDLAYSVTRNRIYASVPSTGGIYGNYVIAIDPDTRQITGSVFAGSEPNKLAMSDDEQVLYVGLDGAASVRRIVLDQMASDLTFSLGYSQSTGALYVEDIAVMPSQPNIIAVSRRNFCCSAHHEGVAIYNNGVQLPNVTSRVSISNEIEFGDDQTSLYGYDNEISDFAFRRMFVDGNGVSIIQSYQNSFGAYSLEMKHSRGLVCATNGKCLTAASGMPSGTFATGGFASGLAIDVRNSRIFFVKDNALMGFDTNTYQPAGTVSFPGSAHSRAKLVRWGRRGLAFRLTDSRLALAEAAFVTRKLERQASP